MELTQKQMVLTHLKKFGAIDPLTALRKYGVYRLGAIIFLLRKDGLSIATQRMESCSKITGKKNFYALHIYNGNIPLEQ